MPAYVNPFGAYAEGQVQGGEQERATQQGARQARQEDWMNKYINPLDLRQRQRDDELGVARLPYAEMAIPDAYRQARAESQQAQLKAGVDFTHYLGDTNPEYQAGIDADPSYRSRLAPEAYVQGAAEFPYQLQTAQLGVRGEQAQDRGDYYQGRNQNERDAIQARLAIAAGRNPQGGSYVPPSARAFGAPAPAAAAPAAAPAMAPAPAPAVAPAAASYDGNDQASTSPHAAYLMDAYQNVPGFASLHPMQQAAIAHHAVNYNPTAAKSTQPSAADQYATA